MFSLLTLMSISHFSYWLFFVLNILSILYLLSWFYVLFLGCCFFLTLFANFWHTEFLDLYLINFINLLLNHILFVHLSLCLSLEKNLELAKLWGQGHSPPDCQVCSRILIPKEGPGLSQNHPLIWWCFTRKTQRSHWKLLFSWSHWLTGNDTN